MSFSSVDRSVAINQVVTEPHLLKQSNEFETIVKSKSYIEHCDMKAETVGSQREQKIWNFLRVSLHFTHMSLVTVAYELNSVHVLWA